MEIRSALDNLIVIQAGITITDPIAETIRAAHKYVPKQQAIISEFPIWTNDWTLLRVDREVSLRIQWYTIHSQLLVFDADINRAADIASAFFDKYLTALDADVSIGQTVTNSFLRGGTPTLVGVDSWGKSLIGLDLYMDVDMKEGATFT